MDRGFFFKKTAENKSGFTLLEILIIVAIIGILATFVLVSINQSRKKARLNTVKMSLKSALTAIVSCKSGSGTVSASAPGALICSSDVGARWPLLKYGYAYVGGVYDSTDCNFQVSTNGDSESNLVCGCVSQVCE